MNSPVFPNLVSRQPKFRHSLTQLGLGVLGVSLIVSSTEFWAWAQSQPAGQVVFSVGVMRPTLRLGSQGATVEELQALLKLLGYYDGAVDGNFQESTAIAVTTFQRAAGLQPDGIVGQETWNRLLPPSPIPSGFPSPSPATPFPSPTQ